MQYCHGSNRQRITMCSKSKHHSLRDWRQVGVLAEFFACMHIRNMQFNQADCRAFYCIMQSN